MTFILTELSDFGIIMAADSSERSTKKIINHEFNECTKILYFPELNIGISTWGNAKISEININDWLTETIKDFKEKNKDDLKNKCLERLSNFIAEKLNAVFPNGEKVLGLHIAGYSFSRYDMENRPGIFHVHNHNESDTQEINNCSTPEHKTVEPKKFLAEKTKPILNRGDALHLRNGLYKEFAQFFPALHGVKQSFVNVIREKYGSRSDLSKLDLLKIQAESVANWVRLMCNTFSEAGILPHVGKNVKVLLIQENNHRKFVLNEFSEEYW